MKWFRNTSYILWVCVIFFILVSYNLPVSGQKLSFGPKFGLYGSKEHGSAQCDSIMVKAQSSGGNLEHPFIGIFVDYKVSKRFAVRTDINYFTRYTSYSIYNHDDPLGLKLGQPIVKSGVVAPTTIDVQLGVGFYPIKGFQVFANVAPNFNFSYEEPYNDVTRRSHGVEEVLNVVDETPKNLTWHYNFGCRLDVWRFNFELNYQQMLSNSMTNPIEIWGKSYPFETTSKMVSVSIAYRLYSFKIGKKQEVE
ncbi:MAG: outer membrane beta-barrel protein [Flammeovirgaceae bacterium]|nr:outer membrane beta-barrel protein [Flammeovirgaceae bacterium]